MTEEEFSNVVKKIFSSINKSPKELKEERRKEKEQDKKDFKVFRTFIMDNFDVGKNEMKEICKTETFGFCFIYFVLCFNISIRKEENIMDFYRRNIEKIREDLKKTKYEIKKD